MNTLFRASSCSQTRTTRHPRARSSRLTRRSRARLPRIFFRQNAAFCFGHVAWLGQPCQKHPSTNTASRSLGKTKSGFTENARWPEGHRAVAAGDGFRPPASGFRPLPAGIWPLASGIRFLNRPSPPPARDPIRPKDRDQSQLRILVSRTANPPHHRRTLGFGEDIGHILMRASQ